MAIYRSMDLMEVIEECGILSARAMDKFVAKNPDFGEFEWVVEITSFLAGTDGNYSGLPENCYPAEPDEWEIDMFPEQVASMLTMEILKVLGNDYAFPLAFSKLWNYIFEKERKYQDNNMDKDVMEEMNSRAGDDY